MKDYFENHLEVRELVDELIEKIEDIPDIKVKIENIDYAIMMLNKQKKDWDAIIR